MLLKHHNKLYVVSRKGKKIQKGDATKNNLTNLVITQRENFPNVPSFAQNHTKFLLIQGAEKSELTLDTLQT